MRLYILGGLQKKRLIETLDDEHRFESAVLVGLETDTQKGEILVEHKTPQSACADSDSSSPFTSSTLVGDRLYACTYTEILIYQVPQFKELTCISLPCFNALHHVCPTPEGNLLVVNTGLDMVLEITLAGKILREWSVVGENLWDRFSKEIDYRQVASTKPHRSHPNFVFRIGTDIWVTRLFQKDAICLTQPEKRINIGIERPHDGILHDGLLHFTTVNGNLVMVDPDTLRIVDVIDLNAIPRENPRNRGWCRGLMFVDQHRLWVGFTRIRKSAVMEGLNWIKHGLNRMLKNDSQFHRMTC
jgi:hypothetical protein